MLLGCTIGAVAAAGGLPSPAIAGGIWTGTISIDETVHTERPGAVGDSHSRFDATIGAGHGYAYLGKGYTVRSTHVDLTSDVDTHDVGDGCDTTTYERDAATSAGRADQLRLIRAADGTSTLLVSARGSDTARSRHEHIVCADGTTTDRVTASGTGFGAVLQVPERVGGARIGPTVDGSSRHLSGTSTYDACEVDPTLGCGPNDTDVRTRSWDLTMKCVAEPLDENANCIGDTTECPSPPATVGRLSTDPRARFDALTLRRGDRISVDGTILVPTGGWLRLMLHGSDRMRLGHGELDVRCRRPPKLVSGAASYATTTGTISTPHTAFTAAHLGSLVDVTVSPRLTTLTVRAGAGRIGDPVARSVPAAGALRVVAGDEVLAAAGVAPRLDTWPFPPSPEQRPGRPSDHLPAFWADGLPCSVGCRPAGARDGWPLKPFHVQHPLRAGLNERRRANLHEGLDIQAADGSRVYAVQPGTATVTGVGTVDERVQVGNYQYWHVHHRVSDGQYVTPYATVVGTIIKSAGHLHISEVQGGRDLNPLRPGGRVLAPWTDTAAPIIRRPSITRDASGFHAVVKIFDPQSFRELIKYRTPVLAPAAVAYRGFDASGHDLTGLRWAYRGSQHLPDVDRFVIYTRGAFTPGWSCFAVRIACVPNWKYRLTDGLTPPLPLRTRRLDIYAYDWAGNTTVLQVGVGS